MSFVNIYLRKCGGDREDSSHCVLRGLRQRTSGSSLLAKNTHKKNTILVFFLCVNSRGLEPLTSSMSTKHSNQLSYEFMCVFVRARGIISALISRVNGRSLVVHHVKDSFGLFVGGAIYFKSSASAFLFLLFRVKLSGPCSGTLNFLAK